MVLPEVLLHSLALSRSHADVSTQHLHWPPDSDWWPSDTPINHIVVRWGKHRDTRVSRASKAQSPLQKEKRIKLIGVSCASVSPPRRQKLSILRPVYCCVCGYPKPPIKWNHTNNNQQLHAENAALFIFPHDQHFIITNPPHSHHLYHIPLLVNKSKLWDSGKWSSGTH